jgi:protein-tyrosine phosphatase
LYEVVQKLASLLSSGKKVFIHCMSGATRAPTAILGYLCLYLKHQNWQNPNDVSIFLGNEHPQSAPNMKVVNKMIREYKHI